jgi:hypothetical protein
MNLIIALSLTFLATVVLSRLFFDDRLRAELACAIGLHKMDVAASTANRSLCVNCGRWYTNL